MSESPIDEGPPLGPISVYATAIAAGAAYGLALRGLFGLREVDGVFDVMTFGFLFVVPFALGFLSVLIGERDAAWSWRMRLAVPALSGGLALVVAVLLAWEGWICLWLWLPVYLLLALAGGVVAALIGRWGRRGRAGVAGCVAVLPCVLAPIEVQLPLPDEIRAVHNAIVIDASPAIVWANIARVAEFEPHEHGFAWVHAIGFPRPLEATLSHEGVGGVRHASFERGVVFVETVTLWQPERALAFSIEADPDSIPARALDQHVSVGGEFFDVLDGRYDLERLADGRIRLHLSSRHRLSTRFNLYARLWTDFIMADTQRHILEMIQRRCESAAAARR